MVGREKYFFIIDFNKSTYNGEAETTPWNWSWDLLQLSSNFFALYFSLHKDG